MKKVVWILIAVMLLCGCSNSAESPDASAGSESEAGSESQEEMPEAGDGQSLMVFPKTNDFIGDTMPFFDDGVMNIYYLADQRDGKTGYHPWGLLRTKDYSTYEDMGIVIPYGESAEDQDIALGTGCVMKDQNGLYHAFYTGHNDYRSPKEAIMHATGTDLIHWTKIPEDTFVANENYSPDDFRDPYVFYVEEEQQYWMLVVTRSNNNGVIAKYTSRDLSKWEDGGILFEDDMGYSTNMECPTLLKFGGKWYLSFSDQWPDRVVHFRVSDSINGPFVRPEEETVDGNGFYAGRLETDGENLYVVGWNGTKVGHDDTEDYDWAGNVVVHELVQREDGSLDPVPNEKVMETLSHPVPLKPAAITNTITTEDSTYRFAGDQYELVQFGAVEGVGSTRIEADFSGYEEDDLFGFAFAPDIDHVGALNYVFNIKENRVEFYNTENIVEEDAQSFMDYDFSSGEPIHATIFIGDGVASLYVNDELALSARMYRSQGTAWQLYGVNAGVTVENVAMYR